MTTLERWFLGWAIAATVAAGLLGWSTWHYHAATVQAKTEHAQCLNALVDGQQVLQRLCDARVKSCQEFRVAELRRCEEECEVRSAAVERAGNLADDTDELLRALREELGYD